MLKDQYSWLLTGCAGFIGSNILERLLIEKQKVIGIDNLSNGSIKNLESVRDSLKPELWKNFEFIEADISQNQICDEITKNIDFVLHQAAYGSVPRSFNEPDLYIKNNIQGSLNIFRSSIENNVKRVVYASSSSVYGDIEEMPKVEENIGKALSPYALSKYVCEEFARLFSNEQTKFIGLRYFNVFGPRQNPEGPYAAVVPKWIERISNNKTVEIYGDGLTSRDFCFVSNVIDVNIISALQELNENYNVVNVAGGKKVSLNDLYACLAEYFDSEDEISLSQPVYLDFRKGDVKHSLASTDSLNNLFNYSPKVTFEEGIAATVSWYKKTK
tara:strand:+ start:525 stop:1511 length:987 start_codon:yes stop_codon:yes gene_type:complete